MDRAAERDNACRVQAERVELVTLEGQIIEFLCSNRRRLVCDNCLKQRLLLPRGATIDMSIKLIGAAVGFRRATEACTICDQCQVGTLAQ
jgi:hypothetical protein